MLLVRLELEGVCSPARPIHETTVASCKDAVKRVIASLLTKPYSSEFAYQCVQLQRALKSLLDLIFIIIFKQLATKDLGRYVCWREPSLLMPW